MLHRSGDNLESEALNFVKNREEITLFSAYIKTDELRKINENMNIKQLVVRWELRDLSLGVSDFENLYEYCIENKIAFFRNTRIHLKAFWSENKVLFGSANVTNRGLGEKGNFNFELNGIQHELSFEDKQYFQKLINSSEYVDESLMVKLKDLFSPLPTITFPTLPTPPPVKNDADYFLINQLPMTQSPGILWDLYLKLNQIKDPILQDCVAHDLEVYSVRSGISDRETFLKELGETFNAHPFFTALKKQIKETTNDRNPDRNGSMHFGGVTRWITGVTTTVPTPRPYDIKNECNSLYDWICDLDPNNFSWSRPGRHSQVIKYIGN